MIGFARLALPCICALLLLLYAFTWHIACTYPLPLEYEGHVFSACMQLAHGGNIYDPSLLSHRAWCVLIYNPLFITIGAGLLKVFGSSLVSLRAISIVSTLVAFIWMYRLCRRCGVSAQASTTATIMFAATVPVIYWSALARVDLLGLALAIVGLERFVVAYRSESIHPKRIATTASLLLFVLAVFAKQQYIVFPVACTFFLFRAKQFKAAALYLVSWCVPSVAIAYAVDALTHGYFLHLTYAASLPRTWESFWFFTGGFFKDPKTLAACVAITATLLAARKRRAFELALILLMVSIAVCAYTVGIKGAYHNHLLCTEFALFWCAAIALDRLPPAFLAGALFCTIISLSSTSKFALQLETIAEMRTETESAIAEMRRLPSSKRVLSEDAFLPIVAGKTPAMVDTTTFLNMVPKHPDVETELLQCINRQEFSAIIVDRRDAFWSARKIWTPKLMQAIRAKYRMSYLCSGNGARHVMFLPRPIENDRLAETRRSM